jgi:hypothetical protein
MKMMNIEGLSPAEIQQRVDSGWRFIHFSYTISLIIITFRGVSGVYLLRSRKNASIIFYTLLSFLFGWWGIPYGPQRTIAAIMTNLRGGKDVTREIMAIIDGYQLFEEVNNIKRVKSKIPKDVKIY